MIDAAGDVAELIARVPGLTVLATSRAPLRIRAEREYPRPPLPVQPDGVLRCEDAGSGTRVSYEFTLHGPLGRLMAPGLRRGMERHRANLERVLENGG